MPVDDIPTLIQYTAPGGSNDYPVPFPFFKSADLVVVTTQSAVETVRVLGTDYTVTGGEDGLGAAGPGTVTGAFTAGALVTIYLDLPFDQEIKFENADPLPAPSLNKVADKLTLLMQQLRQTVTRVILLPISSTIASITFPLPSAGKFLRWNPTADGFENADVTSLGSIGVPIGLSDGGTGQTSAAAAWAALLQKASAAEKLAGTNDTKAVTVLRINQELIAARLAQFTLSR
jgi:hypothetical protein